MNRRVSSLLAALGLLCAGGTVFADEPQDVKSEIRDLQARLTTLEARLVEQESRVIPPTGQEGGMPQLIPGINMSGYVDVAYGYNFNEPNNFANTARVFDTESNGFTPHAAELVIEKPVSDETPVGFRTDLFFGDDAELIHSTGAGTATDQFDLQQAYIAVRAPVGNGLDVKVGKFVTPMGAEVIESPANWNYSRSFLFGYAIPFTHTGVQASYAWNEWFSTMVGAYNGWDIVDDNNKGKTLMAGWTLGPWNNLALSTTFMHGAERANNSHDQRTVMSNVLTWTPNDKWAFMGEYTYGWDEDAVGTTAAVTDGTDNAHWNGLALYAKYNVSDTWSLAGRWEAFNDDDNFRVANAGTGLTDIRYFGYTLTSQWKIHEKLIARLEYRLDQANAQVFRYDQGVNNYQNTVSAELIYPF